MKKQIFIVQDKSDSSFNKPFVSLHKEEKSAIQKVNALQSKLPTQSTKLVSYQPYDVEDFDPNKSSVYVIFNKTDAGIKINNSVASIQFDYAKTEEKIKKLKMKLPPYVQKLIFTKIHPIE